MSLLPALAVRATLAITLLLIFSCFDSSQQLVHPSRETGRVMPRSNKTTSIALLGYEKEVTGLWCLCCLSVPEQQWFSHVRLTVIELLNRYTSLIKKLETWQKEANNTCSMLFMVMESKGQGFGVFAGFQSPNNNGFAMFVSQLWHCSTDKPL